MPLPKSGTWFNKKLRRPFQTLVKIVIVCGFGAILLQTNNSIAGPDSSKPPTSNQPMFQPKLPLFELGNVDRGKKLFYCGIKPCSIEETSELNGCIHCHSNNFDTEPYKSAYTNTVLHAASKKMLYDLSDCTTQIYFIKSENEPEGYNCDKQKTIFKGFTEQDFRDLAAFLSSKDTNQYLVSGSAGPYTKIVAKSDYLPNVEVTSVNGSYGITLAAGDYKIVPELPGYSFYPKASNITLDYIQCTAEEAKDAISDSYSHELKMVNFVQKKLSFSPDNSWPPKINFDKK